MSIFHRFCHPILHMASSRRRVITILLMTGALCILVLFETDTTGKRLWTFYTEGPSKLGHWFRHEYLRPCACNRCATHDDDPWFMERLNASLNPFLTQDNALSEHDFSWWKVNIFNKAMLDRNDNKQVDLDSKHSQNPHQIYQYSKENFS